ncbi:MAG: ribosomal-processing cysteine protease Prp [Eubacteriales bacterium]|nr:ribosomal-processing cysteine protease Prp [Eubacteriales bacterium]
MISCCFYEVDGRLEAFEILGHAGYAEYGNDVICAAISTLAQTAIRTCIEELKLVVDYELDSESGKIVLKLKDRPKMQRQLEDYHLILANTLIGIKMAQEAYPDFIKWEVK